MVFFIANIVVKATAACAGKLDSYNCKAWE
jgi:hypothetical protein